MISNNTEIHFLKNLHTYNGSLVKNTISAFIKTNITINHPQDFDLGVCSVLIWKYLSKILLLSM